MYVEHDMQGWIKGLVVSKTKESASIRDDFVCFFPAFVSLPQGLVHSCPASSSTFPAFGPQPHVPHPNLSLTVPLNEASVLNTLRHMHSVNKNYVYAGVCVCV